MRAHHLSSRRNSSYPYQPNQWAMTGEMTGSAGSAQLGGVDQQMVGQGMNRPATIEIRSGYQFDVDGDRGPGVPPLFTICKQKRGG